MNTKAEEDLSQALVGAWLLEAFVIERPDGSSVHPYGEDAGGTLLYTDDGAVSAVLSQRDRGAFGSTTLERAHDATAEDKVRAFDGYTSYSGRYIVDGQTIVHQVQYSLVPTMIGESLRRQATLKGDSLVLRYLVEGAAGAYIYELRWNRA